MKGKVWKEENWSLISKHEYMCLLGILLWSLLKAHIIGWFTTKSVGIMSYFFIFCLQLSLEFKQKQWGLVGLREPYNILKRNPLSTNIKLQTWFFFFFFFFPHSSRYLQEEELILELIVQNYLNCPCLRKTDLFLP